MMPDHEGQQNQVVNPVSPARSEDSRPPGGASAGGTCGEGRE